MLASLFGFLAAAELARGLLQNNRMWGGGGGGGGGDARTVPSIKVSSAFVYLGKNNSSLSSNPRIFEMNLS